MSKAVLSYTANGGVGTVARVTRCCRGPLSNHILSTEVLLATELLLAAELLVATCY